VSIEPNADFDVRVARAEAAAADALAERNRVWEEALRARALEQELRVVRRLLADMESSISWRITAPLRLGKASAMRHRRLAQRARGRLQGR